MTSINKLYNLSLLAIAFVLPSGFYQAALGVLAVTGICFLVNGQFRKIPALISRPSILFPVLLYAYVLVGYLLADHKRDALSSISTTLPFLLYPLIVGTTSSSLALAKRIENVFVASTCFFLVIAITYAAYDSAVTGEKTLLVGESLYNKFNSYGLTRVFPDWHPTYVALFANHCAFIVLDRVTSAPSNLKRIVLSLLLYVFLSVCTVLLSSVTGIIVLVLTTLYFFGKIIYRFAIPGVLKLFLILVLAGGAGALFFFNPMRIQKIDSLKQKEFKITDNQEERNLLTIRLAKWKTHIALIQENFWFGTTHGDIKTERKKMYQAKGYQDLAQYNYNAHNEFIETLAIYGCLGFLIFMLILLTPLFQQSYHTTFIRFLVIVAITFLTESVLQRQQGLNYVMFFFSVYAWPFGRNRNRVESSDVKHLKK